MIAISNNMELNKQEIELLIESLELDLNGGKLDGFHRKVYQNILAKLKQYEGTN